MIDFRSIHLDHQVILMDRRIQPGKFRLVTHIISYFFFNYIHHILVHCHSACFCNRHPFNLLLHCFLCIFIDFYTDFPYVLIKNALPMYGRPVQLYVSILNSGNSFSNSSCNVPFLNGLPQRLDGLLFLLIFH